MNKKIKEQIEELQDVIFICNCILRETDSQQDYEVAEKQLFQSEVELQELFQKIAK